MKLIYGDMEDGVVSTVDSEGYRVIPVAFTDADIQYPFVGSRTNLKAERRTHQFQYLQCKTKQEPQEIMIYPAKPLFRRRLMLFSRRLKTHRSNAGTPDLCMSLLTLKLHKRN
jgi:hypothetical protein